MSELNNCRKFNIMFSKACEYGLRAVIITAAYSEKDQKASLNEIAGAINSPLAFTAKILQKLVRDKIMLSTKGAYGGFQIQKGKLKKLTIARIVKAIDGDKIYISCGLGLKECSDARPCPVHDKFIKIREDLRTMLETTTIEELASMVTSGEGILRNKKNNKKKVL